MATTTTLRAYLNDLSLMLENESPTEVVTHCRYILQHYPRNVDTYRLLGQALLQKGHSEGLQTYFGEAAEIFQRVLSVIPDDYVAHLGLGEIREQEGSLDHAIWHLERAYEVNPNNTALQEALHEMLSRRAGEDQISTRIQLTRGALARQYARSQLFDQALIELRDAIDESPHRIDLEVLLAETLWDSQHPVEAGEVAVHILKKLPNCLAANRILARLWLGSQRPSDAESYLERIEGLDPYEAARVIRPDLDEVFPDPNEIDRLDYGATAAASLSSETPDWVQDLGDDLSVYDPLAAAPMSMADIVSSPGPDKIDTASIFGDEPPEWESAMPSATPEAHLSNTGLLDWFADTEQPADTTESSPLDDVLGDSDDFFPAGTSSVSNEAESVPDWFSDVVSDSPAEDSSSQPHDDWMSSFEEIEAVKPDSRSEASGFTGLLEGIEFNRQSPDDDDDFEAAGAAEPDWISAFGASNASVVAHTSGEKQPDSEPGANPLAWLDADTPDDDMASLFGDEGTGSQGLGLLEDEQALPDLSFEDIQKPKAEEDPMAWMRSIDFGSETPGQEDEVDEDTLAEADAKRQATLPPADFDLDDLLGDDDALISAGEAESLANEDDWFAGATVFDHDEKPVAEMELSDALIPDDPEIGDSGRIEAETMEADSTEIEVDHDLIESLGLLETSDEQVDEGDTSDWGQDKPAMHLDTDMLSELGSAAMPDFESDSEELQPLPIDASADDWLTSVSDEVSAVEVDEQASPDLDEVASTLPSDLRDVFDENAGGDSAGLPSQSDMQDLKDLETLFDEMPDTDSLVSLPDESETGQDDDLAADTSLDALSAVDSFKGQLFEDEDIEESGTVEQSAAPDTLSEEEGTSAISSGLAYDDELMALFDEQLAAPADSREDLAGDAHPGQLDEGDWLSSFVKHSDIPAEPVGDVSQDESNLTTEDEDSLTDDLLDSMAQDDAWVTQDAQDIELELAFADSGEPEPAAEETDVWTADDSAMQFDGMGEGDLELESVHEQYDEPPAEVEPSSLSRLLDAKMERVDDSPSWMADVEPIQQSGRMDDSLEGMLAEPYDPFEGGSADKVPEYQSVSDTGVLQPDEIPDWMLAFTDEEESERIQIDLDEDDSLSEDVQESVSIPAPTEPEPTESVNIDFLMLEDEAVLDDLDTDEPDDAFFGELPDQAIDLENESGQPDQATGTGILPDWLAQIAGSESSVLDSEIDALQEISEDKTETDTIPGVDELPSVEESVDWLEDMGFTDGSDPDSSELQAWQDFDMLAAQDEGPVEGEGSVQPVDDILLEELSDLAEELPSEAPEDVALASDQSNEEPSDTDEADQDWKMAGFVDLGSESIDAVDEDDLLAALGELEDSYEETSSEVVAGSDLSPEEREALAGLFDSVDQSSADDMVQPVDTLSLYEAAVVEDATPEWGAESETEERQSFDALTDAWADDTSVESEGQVQGEGLPLDDASVDLQEDAAFAPFAQHEDLSHTKEIPAEMSDDDSYVPPDFSFGDLLPAWLRRPREERPSAQDSDTGQSLSPETPEWLRNVFEDDEFEND